MLNMNKNRRSVILELKVPKKLKIPKKPNYARAELKNQAGK